MSATSSSYAVLSISGADACDFLRAQLTVDVRRIGLEHHALAAWCDAGGRVLCSCRIIPRHGGFLLLLPSALVDSIRRRLQMYVLRARVDVADTTEQWFVGALRANDITDGTSLPAGGVLQERDGALLLGLDMSDGAAALSLASANSCADAQAATTNAWQLAEVDAGLPEITTATSGLFLPQMLNMHWLGALEFDKGCYPGQEVIARLQYRGRLTRRLFRAQWQGRQPDPGDDIHDANGTRQGTVIRAARVNDDTGRLLAVIRTDAHDQALVSGDGSPLQLLDLPYATDEQAAANA